MPSNPWDVRTIEAKAPDAKSVTEARKVLTKGGFGTVEPRADGRGWWVVCQGMTGTYEVTVRHGPRGGLESRCTCPSSKKPCKHALALLLYLAEHPEARPEAAAPAARATIDLESLLRAAFGTEDDTPRLALADYFDENDQPERAALIRTQCALARLGPKDDGRQELLAQEAKQLAAVWELIGKLPNGYTATFVRGFLRLKVGYPKIKTADGLPARFVKLFRDGWVETLIPQLIVSDLIPLYRLVGELDLSRTYLSGSDLSLLARELKPDDLATRVRTVRLPADKEGLYRALLKGGVTS